MMHILSENKRPAYSVCDHDVSEISNYCFGVKKTFHKKIHFFKKKKKTYVLHIIIRFIIAIEFCMNLLWYYLNII
jgi:hypothetical protein